MLFVLIGWIQGNEGEGWNGNPHRETNKKAN
jgi:hypothetical protein